MNAQHAIERVLQDFTKELLKVFSDAVVQAVSQVGSAGAAALPAAQSAAASIAKRAARAPAAKAPAAKATPKAPSAKAAPKAAPKAARPGALLKSTPDQVNRLSERVIEVLRKSARNLAAKEIMKAMGLRTTDEGRFQYALNKLKEDGVVQQHGERRQARYGIGTVSKPKPKRGPGRPRKVQPTEAVVEAAESKAPAAPADESLAEG